MTLFLFFVALAMCGSFLPHSPSLGLSLEFCAIESFSEIFGELSGSDFRILDFYGTSIAFLCNCCVKDSGLDLLFKEIVL